ncbi:hypothetical protein V8B55DRAFT_1483078, partial [Mucor lusitanicus]|uniref:DUF4211 domain-containing protein n=2 Tax=Mucor circinelloides f. lusitanicus TaxID=29924 RepID=A0A168I064_MUCCL|nr:hypothetical protein FB192DRAFT_1379761 [Mucor lusitanicus]OAC99397.1 hypothetical protein MUCCIDRAFT_114587 [Mucor lusitanicus CBS 277.49]
MTKPNTRKRQQNLLNYFKASTQEEHNEPIQHVSEASTSTSSQINYSQQKSEDFKKKNLPLVVIKSKKKPAIPLRKKKVPVIVVSDEEEMEQDDGMDEEVIVRKTNKKRRLIAESSDEEEEAEAPITTAPGEATSDEDMEDDLDFLDKSDILKSRTRGKRLDSYAENLKKLRDRKLKAAQYNEVEDGPMDSFVSPRHNTVIIDTSSESDQNDNGEDDEDESTSGGDEDDFVVDDDIVDGQRVQTPIVNAALPAEFSTSKAMSFGRQMDFYIQSLVELVLNPAFDISSNQKYTVANDTINKRVQAYRDSMATSDVWLPEFKGDMDKYTQWTQLHNYVYDGFDVCEACRANKPARISIKLYSDDELDFETYLIGSECSKKAFIYHELKHFRAHMYQKVRNLVSDNRYNANTSQEVFDNLLQKGHVRKLRKSITSLFSSVVLRYNPRGQRAGVVDDDSDDSSDNEDMY